MQVDHRGRTSRTLKYSFAILKGLWIVGLNCPSQSATSLTRAGVEASVRAGVWLDETEFEVSGDYSFIGGPAKGRARTSERVHLASALLTTKMPKLLHGASLYFLGEFAHPMPDRESLAELAEMAGADVLRRPVRPRNANLVLVLMDASKTSEADAEECLEMGADFVGAQWLLDCISSVEVLDVVKYKV